MAIQNKPKYKANPAVSCRIEEDNNAILYHPGTDTTILLNKTGLCMWQYLDEPRSEDEILAHLTEVYGELPDQNLILEDVRLFLESLGDEYLCKEP